MVGFEVEVRFVGPVDTAITGLVVENLLATIREALTNVEKHARATSATVEVSVDMDTCRLASPTTASASTRRRLTTRGSDCRTFAAGRRNSTARCRLRTYRPAARSSPGRYLSPNSHQLPIPSRGSAGRSRYPPIAIREDLDDTDVDRDVGFNHPRISSLVVAHDGYQNRRAPLLYGFRRSRRRSAGLRVRIGPASPAEKSLPPCSRTTARRRSSTSCPDGSISNPLVSSTKSRVPSAMHSATTAARLDPVDGSRTPVSRITAGSNVTSISNPRAISSRQTWGAADRTSTTSSVRVIVSQSRGLDCIRSVRITLDSVPLSHASRRLSSILAPTSRRRKGQRSLRWSPDFRRVPGHLALPPRLGPPHTDMNRVSGLSPSRKEPMRTEVPRRVRTGKPVQRDSCPGTTRTGHEANSRTCWVTLPT